MTQRNRLKRQGKNPMLRIKGPKQKGVMIAKPAIGLFRPKDQRFLNYAEDEYGRPYGSDFEIDVPDCEYYRRMIAKGEVDLVEPKKPKKSGGNK